MALLRTSDKGLVQSKGLVYNSAEAVRPAAIPSESAMPTNERHDLLRRTALFAGLTDGELRRLAADLHRCRYAAGETIFNQGDPGNALYIVEAGRVRIYVPTEEGQEVSVVLYGPGDMFGEMALVDRRPRSAAAVAMEDAVLLAMSSRHFDRHLRENYQLALNVMELLSRRLRETTDQVRAMASLDVSRRAIQTLLQLAERQGTPSPEGVRLGRLTQQELASLVGTSRESVNRALRALARKGLVDVARGEILLRRLEELAALLGEKGR